MDLQQIKDSQKSQYNKLVTHVMQSWEWGEFREAMGLKVGRYGLFENGKLKTAFQITFHKIPYVNQSVGYLPKGPFPDKELSQALKQIAKDEQCAFIKIEPHILSSDDRKIDQSFKKSSKPLFTKYNFVLDLSKSEEELLKKMHPKTRYNIKVAQRHGVIVEEKFDDQSFETFLKLHFETTQRQGFHSHNEHYHRQLWQILKTNNMARVLIGYYQKKALSAWLLFNFKDTLYYPYGASTIEHREVMANNLVAWQAILIGQKLKCKTFDMWGAAHSPNPDQSDPFYGFHKFKEGYGAKLEEYLGTYDLVLNQPIYQIFSRIDKATKLKVALLKLLRK